MLETFGFTDFILPTAEKMAVAVTYLLSYHLATARGQASPHNLMSFLTAAGVDVSTHPTEATILPTDGSYGIGDIAMGSAEATFSDSRKVVLSLISPFLSYTPTPSKILLSPSCPTRSTPDSSESIAFPNIR
jgi:hypothetical protein